MVLFHYQAMSREGKREKGVIEAPNDKEARLKLRERGVMILKLSSKRQLFSEPHLKGDSLMHVTGQLSQLLRAGLPLYEAIVALQEQYQGEGFQGVLIALGEAIHAGASLSEAMAKHPQSFDRLYCSMIAAGESSGALVAVLEKLAQLIRKEQALRKQIITAMIYPGLLAAFSICVVFALLTFALPSMEAVFADRELNGFTNMILKISHFLTDYWYLYLPCLLGGFAFAMYKLRSPAGKRWKDRTSLKLPLIKTLVIQAALARFSRTMATLLQGGVNIIESLRIAKKVMKNELLEELIQRAEERVIQGSRLSLELKKSPLMPRMVTRMLAVGEESGDFPGMLQNIAEIYEADLEKNLSRLTALAQPAILLFMGFVVGVIMLAVLLPLTDISAFT